MRTIFAVQGISLSIWERGSYNVFSCLGSLLGWVIGLALMSGMGPLKSGGRVIVLGAGPAGSACAIMLHRLAVDRGIDLQITLVEGKEFSGELHYNQCAGVLSPPLPELMEEELQVRFPSHLVRSSISGYILHVGNEELVMKDTKPSVALRRVQFDDYMLKEARKRGIDVMRVRAVDLEILENQVHLYTESQPLSADLIVGAFGLDEGSGGMFSRVSPYQAPSALSSIVTKLIRSPEAMELFGNDIHAFLPRDHDIEFGAITPKGGHLTINIAGDLVNASTMSRFLAQPEVRRFIVPPGSTEETEARYFKGRFPTDLAQGYYGDRYVMIGDAAGLVRPFKGKGVTSAMTSAIRAARTAIDHGISRRAFHKYYRTANRDIISDLPYGKAARQMTIMMARMGLLDGVVRAAQNDKSLEMALHGAVSGHLPYREVLQRSFHPRSVMKIAFATLVPRRSKPAEIAPVKG